MESQIKNLKNRQEKFKQQYINYSYIYTWEFLTSVFRLLIQTDASNGFFRQKAVFYVSLNNIFNVIYSSFPKFYLTMVHHIDNFFG